MNKSVVYNIAHTTCHRYEEPVSFSRHHCRLYPRGGPGVRVLEHEIRAFPEADRRIFEDHDGNRVFAFYFGLQTALELRFELILRVEQDEVNPYDFILEGDAVEMPVVYGEEILPWLDAYRRVRSEKEEGLDLFVKEVCGRDLNGRGTVELLAELNLGIHDAISYERRDEEGIQDVATTLGRRKGSCRDMGWLFIEGCRSLGLAARFVSGYLYDPPNSKEAFNRAVGSMHAWAEIFLPGAGWKGFDPTNGVLANHFFIPTAVSGDPALADPIQGRYYANSIVTSNLEIDLEIEMR